MKKIILLFYLISTVILVQAQTVWSIGEKDNSAAEFALAPDKYADFLKNDFGWEDRYYIIGLSKPEKDFPTFSGNLRRLGRFAQYGRIAHTGDKYPFRMKKQASAEITS